MTYAALGNGDASDLNNWYVVSSSNRADTPIAPIVVTSSVKTVGVLFGVITGTVTVELWSDGTLIESDTQTPASNKWALFNFTAPYAEYTITTATGGITSTYFIATDEHPVSLTGDLYLCSTLNWDTATVFNLITNIGTISSCAALNANELLNYGTIDLTSGSIDVGVITNFNIFQIIGPAKMHYTATTAPNSSNVVSLDAVGTWGNGDTILVGGESLTILGISGLDISYDPEKEIASGTTIFNLTHSCKLSFTKYTGAIILTNVFLDLTSLSTGDCTGVLTNCVIRKGTLSCLALVSPTLIESTVLTTGTCTGLMSADGILILNGQCSLTHSRFLGGGVQLENTNTATLMEVTGTGILTFTADCLGDIRVTDSSFQEVAFDNAEVLDLEVMDSSFNQLSITESFVRANFYNCVIPVELAAAGLLPDSYINFNSGLGSRNLRPGGLHEQDFSIYHSAPVSIKITPDGQTETDAFRAYVESGSNPYVSFIIKRTDYVGTPPQIVVKANRAIGYLEDTVIAEAYPTYDKWEGIAGYLPTATAYGVADVVLRVEGTAGTVHVDSFNSGSGNFADGTMIIPDKGMPFARMGNIRGKGSVSNNTGTFIVEASMVIDRKKTLLLCHCQPNAFLEIQEIKITCTGALKHRQLTFAISKLKNSGLAKGEILSPRNLSGKFYSQATWMQDLHIEPAEYDNPYHIMAVLSTTSFKPKTTFRVSPNGGIGIRLMNTPVQAIDCHCVVVFKQTGG